MNATPPTSRAWPQPAAGSSDRCFGLVFAGFFLLLGCAPLLTGGAARWWALGLAAMMGALALAAPKLLSAPNRLWSRFGRLLHAITSPVALALIYVLGVVPAGLVLRILRRNPLALAREPGLESYWITRDPPGRADEGMKNQF